MFPEQEEGFQKRVAKTNSDHWLFELLAGTNIFRGLEAQKEFSTGTEADFKGSLMPVLNSGFSSPVLKPPSSRNPSPHKSEKIPYLW